MDFDALTLGDIEDIENYAGLPVSFIADTTKPGAAKLRTALVWIVKRKADPTFTIDDARNLPSSEMNAILFGEVDEEKKA
jgi:hypothetical protein